MAKQLQINRISDEIPLIDFETHEVIGVAFERRAAKLFSDAHPRAVCGSAYERWSLFQEDGTIIARFSSEEMAKEVLKALGSL